MNFDDEDVIARVQELTDGRGADVCVEAVGFRYVKSLHHRIQKTLKLETDSIDALNDCIRACRKYARDEDPRRILNAPDAQGRDGLDAESGSSGPLRSRSTHSVVRRPRLS